MTSEYTARSYAGHLGIVTVDDRWSVGDPVWTGAVLHACHLSASADWWHEIAHWLIATPDERAEPNFGLGVDWRGGGPKLDVTPEMAETEHVASVLGIALEREEGGDWWGTADDHGWLVHEMVGDGTEERSVLDPCFTALEERAVGHVQSFREWMTS